MSDADSLRNGHSGYESPSEHEVLCEMNADFYRSKVELIHRFLSDQEELNKRFAEYALDTDDDNSESDVREKYQRNISYPPAKTKPQVLTEADILQDLECRSILDDDNLSITSAINSSFGGGSDIAVLDDDPTFGTDLDLPREATFPVRDKNGNISRNKPNKLQRDGQSFDETLEAVPSTKREKGKFKKPRKILTKKNVRPQTAAGIRRGPDIQTEMDMLQQRLEEDQSKLHESSLPMTLPQGYAFQSTELRPGSKQSARTRTSWLPDEQHPIFDFRGSSGRHRHYQGVQVPSSTDYGNRKKSSKDHRCDGLLSINMRPGEGYTEPSLAATSRGLTPLGERNLTGGSSSPRGDRYGKQMFGNQAPENRKSASRRNITVLKLPPLESPGSLNKPFLDQGRFVGGATKGSVTPAAEFLAG